MSSFHRNEQLRSSRANHQFALRRAEATFAHRGRPRPGATSRPPARDVFLPTSKSKTGAQREGQCRDPHLVETGESDSRARPAIGLQRPPARNGPPKSCCRAESAGEQRPPARMRWRRLGLPQITANHAKHAKRCRINRSKQRTEIRFSFSVTSVRSC